MREPDRPALNDEADVLAVLRALVQQLASSGYRDKFGNPIELNLSFLDAIALLQLHGIAP